jgi:hypothetical protein
MQTKHSFATPAPPNNSFTEQIVQLAALQRLRAKVKMRSVTTAPETHLLHQPVVAVQGQHGAI